MGGLIAPVDSYLDAYSEDPAHYVVTAYANDEGLLIGLDLNHAGAKAVGWPHPLAGPIVVLEGWTSGEICEQDCEAIEPDDQGDYLSPADAARARRHGAPAAHDDTTDASDDDTGDEEGPIVGDYTLTDLYQMMVDGVAEAVPCGCRVEPDGVCACGNPSALELALGVL